MNYIKGLGWIDETPKRGLKLVCQEGGCSKEWEAEYPALTEAEIAHEFPEGEPLPSWCAKHETQVDWE